MTLSIDTSLEKWIIKITIQEIEFEQETDTYYLAIDSSFMENDESDKKVLLNLKTLFVGWLNLIKDINANEIIYLPFDFSDEYIGCFRVQSLNNSELDIQYGCTRKFTGYSLYPSQLNQFVISTIDFEQSTVSYTQTREKLLSDIASWIKMIDEKIKKL